MWLDHPLAKYGTTKNSKNTEYSTKDFFYIHRHAKQLDRQSNNKDIREPPGLEEILKTLVLC